MNMVLSLLCYSLRGGAVLLSILSSAYAAYKGKVISGDIDHGYVLKLTEADDASKVGEKAYLHSDKAREFLNSANTLASQIKKNDLVSFTTLRKIQGKWYALSVTGLEPGVAGEAKEEQKEREETTINLEEEPVREPELVASSPLGAPATFRLSAYYGAPKPIDGVESVMITTSQGDEFRVFSKNFLGRVGLTHVFTMTRTPVVFYVTLHPTHVNVSRMHARFEAKMRGEEGPPLIYDDFWEGIYKKEIGRISEENLLDDKGNRLQGVRINFSEDLTTPELLLNYG